MRPVAAATCCRCCCEVGVDERGDESDDDQRPRPGLGREDASSTHLRQQPPLSHTRHSTAHRGNTHQVGPSASC